MTPHINADDVARLARALIEECQTRKIDLGVKSASVTRYFRDRINAAKGA